MREERIGGYKVAIVGEIRTVSIYAIYAAGSDDPVYVGSTVRGVRERIRGHCSAARDGSDLPVHQWIRKQVGGLRVVVLETIRDVASERTAREKFWVKQFPNLLNITDGGGGGSGTKWSDERREKLAAAIRTGAYFFCRECGAQFWRKQKEIKRGHNKFCSKKCYQDSIRGVTRPMPKGVMERGVAAAAKARRARTHCINGHEFSLENTRINKSGARVCRQCLRDHKMKQRQKMALADA